MKVLALDTIQLYALAASAIIAALEHADDSKPVSPSEMLRRISVGGVAHQMLTSTKMSMADLEKLGHMISDHALSIDKPTKG